MEPRPNVTPNTALAVVGSIFPLAFAFGAGGVLLGALGLERLERLIEAAGPLVYAVILSSFVMAAMMVPLIILIGRGRQLPVVIPLGLATVPWWVGLGTMEWGLHQMMEAVAAVNPADKLIIFMAGLSEATGGRVIGAWYASALLCGTALGLAFASAAMRPKDKSAIGLIAAVPMLGAIGVGVMAMIQARSGLAIPFVVLPALVVTAAAGLAGLFLGVGVEQRSTAAVSVGAIIAGALGLAAGVAAFGALQTSSTFEAVATMDPAEKVVILAAGLSGVVAANHAGTWTMALAVVALAIIVVLAFRRGRPAGPALGGLIAAVVFGAIVVVVDSRTVPNALEQLFASGGPTAASASSVTLPTVHSPGPEQAGAGVTVSAEAVTVDLVTLNADALDEGTPDRRLLVRALAKQLAQTRDLHEFAGDHVDPSLSFAVDAKRDGAIVRRLAQLAADAGAERIVFLTQAAPREEKRLEGLPSEYAKVLELFAPKQGSVELRLGVDERRDALTAVVGGTGPVQLKSADGKVVSSVDPSAAAEPAGETRTVLLEAGPGANLERVLDVASVLVARGDSVAVAGVHRSDPPPVADDDFAGDQGSADSQKGGDELNELPDRFAKVTIPVDDGSPKHVPHGKVSDGRKPTVLGGLDLATVRTTVRKRFPEVQACYQKSLTAFGPVEGTVAMSFVIGPDGSVQSAEIAEDGLQDPDVGDCIGDAMRTWKFAKPKGGGVVSVTYPFVLQLDL